MTDLARCRSAPRLGDASWRRRRGHAAPARPRAFLAHQRPRSLRTYARDLDDFAHWRAEHALPLLPVRRGTAREAADDDRPRAGGAVQLLPPRRRGRVPRPQPAGRRPPHPRRRRLPRLGFDRDQADALLEAAAAAGARDHALACLLVLSGLRVSETCALRAVDLGALRGHRVAHVPRKGGAAADVPVVPRTAAAVDKLLAERRAEVALFVDDA